MSPEVAADAAEPPGVVVHAAVFPEATPAAVSPEVAAHAAEPPEAAVFASAPCMVVAPSNVLSACHVTVKETVTTVEPPEVAVSAAEPSEVSVVTTCESSSFLNICTVLNQPSLYQGLLFRLLRRGGLLLWSGGLLLCRGDIVLCRGGLLLRSGGLLLCPGGLLYSLLRPGGLLFRPGLWFPAPPWFSALPWLPASPVLPGCPARLAQPQSPVFPLPRGPGPPSLPLFRLRSTSHLDFIKVGVSGSRSLGGGGCYVTNPGHELLFTHHQNFI